jgi:hypothetical protein
VGVGLEDQAGRGGKSMGVLMMTLALCLHRNLRQRKLLPDEGRSRRRGFGNGSYDIANLRGARSNEGPALQSALKLLDCETTVMLSGVAGFTPSSATGLAQLVRLVVREFVAGDEGRRVCSMSSEGLHISRVPQSRGRRHR